jgi:predicted Mrr-cat superfamily restriction endonuclease
MRSTFLSQSLRLWLRHLVHGDIGPMADPIDNSTLEIEGLDISIVSETQIIEFISRKRIDLARLATEILVASGFQTSVSSFGHDGSISILAEGKAGPLGFKLPRIAVLVKPNIEPANPDVRELEAFLALSGAFNGLFVSWTGFTEAAEREACRLFHQAKFWNVGTIVEMLKDNYSLVSNDLKSALPLKRFWAVTW